ncbi:MAG: hypothetical protein JWM11_5695, partial [Planctomycetaceae bacterium]|nr:hypothetical protein [Planctomycetaceae bacterium]
MRLCLVLTALLIAAMVLANWPHAAALPQTKRQYLVHVSAGETTNDTSSEAQPEPVIVTEPALGGKGLKVTFTAGGSVGQRVTRPDWTPYSRIRFQVVNPGAEAGLELTVIHAGSTNFATRIVVPLTFKSGTSEHVIELAKLQNTNGSPPNLARIKRWYFAEPDGKTPTLVFGDLE